MITARRYVIPLIPPDGVGDNSHVHWQAKRRVVAAYREAVWAYLTTKLAADIPPEPIEHCRIRVVAYYCRKRPQKDSPDLPRFKATRRATDIGNLASDTKAVLDALQPFRRVEPRRLPSGRVSSGSIHWGAGIIRSDSHEHTLATTWEFAPEVETFGEERIEVEVSDLDAAACETCGHPAEHVPALVGGAVVHMCMACDRLGLPGSVHAPAPA